MPCLDPGSSADGSWWWDGDDDEVGAMHLCGACCHPQAVNSILYSSPSIASTSQSSLTQHKQTSSNHLPHQHDTETVASDFLLLKPTNHSLTHTKPTNNQTTKCNSSPSPPFSPPRLSALPSPSSMMPPTPPWPLLLSQLPSAPPARPSSAASTATRPAPTSATTTRRCARCRTEWPCRPAASSATTRRSTLALRARCRSATAPPLPLPVSGLPLALPPRALRSQFPALSKGSVERTTLNGDAPRFDGYERD